MLSSFSECCFGGGFSRRTTISLSFSIAKNLGVMQDGPLPPSGTAGMNFYPTQDNNGYEIPDYFWEYLNSHGSLVVSGAPISHVKPFSEESFRQCFENICLLYDQHAHNYAPVYPDQLGYQYLGLLKDIGTPAASVDQQQQPSIVLRVEEGQPTISSGGRQEIQATVLRNARPVSGVDLAITVTLPDNTSWDYRLPKTGEDGKSSLILPAIQAENGSIILYQVCVINQEQANFCYEDSFAIWTQP